MTTSELHKKMVGICAKELSKVENGVLTDKETRAYPRRYLKGHIEPDVTDKDEQVAVECIAVKISLKKYDNIDADNATFNKIILAFPLPNSDKLDEVWLVRIDREEVVRVGLP